MLAGRDFDIALMVSVCSRGQQQLSLQEERSKRISRVHTHTNTITTTIYMLD